MKRESKLISIIVILVILLIGTNIKLIFNQNTVLTNDRQIIKQMDESTQISSFNSTINELNKSHTDYETYIQTCKKQIATALTNEGVTTSSEEKLETMASNISKILQTRTSDATATADNIAEGKTAYVNGELITGNAFFNSSQSEFIKTVSILANTNLGYQYCDNEINDLIIIISPQGSSIVDISNVISVTSFQTYSANVRVYKATGNVGLISGWVHTAIIIRSS